MGLCLKRLEAVTAEEAVALARACALNALAAAAASVGGLSAITRIVKVTGFVASAPGFTGQPQVVNGASDLLTEVFGDAGKHARSAVGVAVLPMDAPVEVELIAEVGGTGTGEGSGAWNRLRVPGKVAARARDILEGRLTPVVSRDAATVMLVRLVAGQAAEVYMLRRQRSMAFAPGAAQQLCGFTACAPRGSTRSPRLSEPRYWALGSTT